jgi:UDP-N-acetylglucosamine/UDP-N-acetylgalactosamine diphosphorylase
MSSASSLFLAPNGHGGTLAALASSGALGDARARGVTQLSYFQVDNPLARPADPLFLGLHVRARAEMSSKVVAKRDAAEKVGVLGLVDGRMGCIEYSDLPAPLREARDERGRLRFDAGNIAAHVLDVEFVERLTRGALRLPWHVAKKKMSVWRDGRTVELQGAKFETFVFDALGETERSVVLEVERSAEFSPVKNAQGEDSPQTTRADVCRLHASWVRAAQLPLPPADAHGVHPVEVDPLLAEDAREFLARQPATPEITPRGHLYR